MSSIKIRMVGLDLRASRAGVGAFGEVALPNLRGVSSAQQQKFIHRFTQIVTDFLEDLNQTV